MSQVLCPNKTFHHVFLEINDSVFAVMTTLRSTQLGTSFLLAIMDGRCYQALSVFCFHILCSSWIPMLKFWNSSWLEGRQMKWATSCRCSLGACFSLFHFILLCHSFPRGSCVVLSFQTLCSTCLEIPYEWGLSIWDWDLNEINMLLMGVGISLVQPFVINLHSNEICDSRV